MKNMNKIFLILAALFLLTACQSRSSREAAIQQAKQQAIDSMNLANVRQHTIDSMKAVARERRHYSSSSMDAATVGPNGQATQTAAPAERKKKWNWSDPAKGAVIGAGAGAATGAIVDRKNRLAGAAIGAAIGAGAGAGTGVIIDKRKKRHHTANQ